MLNEKPIFFLKETDIYEGNMPEFFETQNLAWVKTLEDNWHVIREEFAEYIDGKKELEQSSLNPPYLSDKTAWQNVYFWNFLWQKHKNCKRYPKTYQLLKSIPNLSFAEVTCLKGHSKILAHIGETNVTMRGHLGLKIPEPLPKMGIQVGKEARGWEEGKVILFSDAQRHHVWNDSDESRFVLVFDVIQEPFVNRKYWMCAQALSALTIKLLDEHFNFFIRLPNALTKGFHFVFSAIWFLYLPIQNRLSFLP
ncbi:MAG: aspartyl/asparaginyl beta-hydroxylase domain-containing protein [Chitinophagales bacterium]|nr:aspartyl/asparaginyl beta-hydroxylase domain-containing protein [Bacteroidota bacterium]MCB9256440.1 aspartyl/asparaginyl beta-hydroxylase domain-containing protein [Chitinophagales bacterium]